MTQEPRQFDEFDDLLIRMIDGSITDAEHALLASILRDSKPARDRYRRILEAHSFLYWQHTAETHPFPHAGQASVAPPTPKAGGRAATKRASMNQSIPPTTWAFAAMSVFAVVLVCAFAYVYRAQPAASAGAAALPDSVAVLFEVSDDAEFTYDGPGGHDNNLRSGYHVLPGIVDLERGALTFKFDCGADVTIEGPARLGLNDGQRAFLHHGKLAAYCPEQARGFTVGAPGLAVIDLGTRFTMLVDTLGFTNVVVIEGQVQLERPETGETVQLTRGSFARAARDLNQRITFGHPIVTVLDAAGDLRFDQQQATAGQAFGPGTVELESGAAALQLAGGAHLALRERSRLGIHGPMDVVMHDGSATFDCRAEGGALTVQLFDGSRLSASGAHFVVARPRGGGADEANHMIVRVFEGVVRLVHGGGEQRELRAMDVVAVTPRGVESRPALAAPAARWLAADHGHASTGQIDRPFDGIDLSAGLTIEAAFRMPDHATWDDSGIWSIFRREGPDRVLLALQNASNIGRFGSSLGDRGYPGISFGLVLGQYRELDVALDGRDGRPTIHDLFDGAVHHVVAVYDRDLASRTIYLDGRMIGASPAPEWGELRLRASRTPGMIGITGRSTAERFGGQLLGVALYGGAMDRTQIEQHYRCWTDGEPPWPGARTTGGAQGLPAPLTAFDGD